MNSSIQINDGFAKEGFTLLELLVVLALVSILGCLLLPAMARTHVKASGSGCLNNYRQMMLGWAIYKDENNDYLVPNSQAGAGNGWIPTTTPNEDWNNSDANTNLSYYLSGVLSPYIGGHIELYRCPGDVIPSQNGLRLRSCSMNSQISGLVSSTARYNANPGYKEFVKGSDLTCQAPKDLFVFADESIWTMNDGWFEVNLEIPDFPDCFAAYHDGAGGVSFADGHAEIHKWVGPYAESAANPAGILGVVYQSGIQRSTSTHVTSSGLDQDWRWEFAHAACKNP